MSVIACLAQNYMFNVHNVKTDSLGSSRTWKLKMYCYFYINISDMKNILVYMYVTVNVIESTRILHKFSSTN